MVFISAIVVNTHQSIGLRKVTVTPAHLESLHQSWGERATHVQHPPFAKRSTLSSSWPTADQRSTGGDRGLLPTECKQPSPAEVLTNQRPSQWPVPTTLAASRVLSCGTERTELTDWLTVDTGRHALGQWSDQQLSSSSVQLISNPDS